MIMEKHLTEKRKHHQHLLHKNPVNHFLLLIDHLKITENPLGKAKPTVQPKKEPHRSNPLSSFTCAYIEKDASAFPRLELYLCFLKIEKQLQSSRHL
jgi:hypothetical protein